MSSNSAMIVLQTAVGGVTDNFFVVPIFQALQKKAGKYKSQKKLAREKIWPNTKSNIKPEQPEKSRLIANPLVSLIDLLNKKNI